MSQSRQIRNRLWGYIRLDRRCLMLAVACSVGVSGMQMLFLWMIKLILDAMDKGNQAHLTLFILGVVGVYAVRWPLVYWQTVLFAEAGQRLACVCATTFISTFKGFRSVSSTVSARVP